MKDFNSWNELKIQLEESNIPLDFREREIWFASLGLNLGHEQDGKHERSLRPVIIIKKFNNDIFWGAPLTHAQKVGPHYYRVSWNNSTAITSQLRLMDRKRLFRKVGVIFQEEHAAIKSNIIKLLV